MADLNNRDDFSVALLAAVAGIHAAGANYIAQRDYRPSFVDDVTNFIFGMDEQVPAEDDDSPLTPVDGFADFDKADSELVDG